MKKTTIFLLCALMLIFSSCVSNKTFKAQEEIVQIMEARQNNQDIQLEMINKELAQHREKLNDIMAQLIIINQQLPEIV
jgi:predicted ATP-dependent endonuclease of OLD family